ncbi:hypothetical protein JL720_12272 [Aureococcus anophagefferens]|nr:hypothetical protein JL720_12272 [Aureococcus anophagefferens]
MFTVQRLRRRRAGGAAPEDDDLARPRAPGPRRRPEYDPGPIVNRAADVLVSVRRAELELAVQRRTLVELREEIAALREARDRDARNEAPAAAAVYKVAARLSTDERRLEEFANVFKAMADRIKVLERQSEGYLEVGQRRLNALEARLGGVGDVGQLAVAAKRTAEEAANNSVAIELQENHLDGVKADVARVGQGVESSKKLAERVRDEGAKVADNLRTSLSGAEAQARAALTDESSARRDAVARAEENAVANVRELERREHERFLDVQTTIDGVDARVVQEVSDREKAVGEVATDVVRRWDAIHEVRVQDQQARQAEGEALRTAIALAHRQTNRAVDDLGDEVRAAKRAFEDRATVEKAERERIDAYQKVATKRFDELERVLSAEIAARRDGASKLAARQVAVEDAARDDLLKSCSKLGARIEDVDHRVGDGLRAMQESALTTAKAVAQCRVELSAAARGDTGREARRRGRGARAAVTVAPTSPDRAEAALAAEAGRFQASVDAAVAAARARSSALAAATRGARGRGRGGRRARRARREAAAARDLLAKNAASCASVCEGLVAREADARASGIAVAGAALAAAADTAGAAAAVADARHDGVLRALDDARGEAAQATAAEGRAARSAARAMVEAEARDRKTADADDAEAASCRRRDGEAARGPHGEPPQRREDARARARRRRGRRARARGRGPAPGSRGAPPVQGARPRRDAAAYLLHRVADEAQGAKNAALAREIDATEDRSRRRFEANGRRLRAEAADARRRRASTAGPRARRSAPRSTASPTATRPRAARSSAATSTRARGAPCRGTRASRRAAIEKRDREVSDETIQRERLVSRAVRSTVNHVADDDLQRWKDDEADRRLRATTLAKRRRAWRDKQEKAADADATAAFAWRTNEENWRRRSDDAGEAAARAWRDKQERADAEAAAASAEAAELQRRRTDDQAALAEAVSTLEDELEDADLRLAATAAAADAATRDALFATDARLGDSLDERASALAGRVDDEVRDRVAALAAHAEKTDETTSALGVDVAEARTAAAALTSDVEVKLLARTSELEAKLEEDLASRGSSLEARAAELEEKLAEEATSRGADFQRVTEDLEAKAAALTDAVAAEAAARDSALVAAKDAEQQRFYETTQENEEKRDALKAELTEALAAESAARTEALASETAAGRGAASRRPRGPSSRRSGLDHKIDEEIRAAGASSTDALQVLKDEIATTEEVKRAELSATLSEDLDGKFGALESKVEDADAKAKALETKLADVEHKLADEASSRAAAVDGCKAAAEAKVAALKSELTDDVSKRVGDVKASLEAEIRDAREKADKAEKSADKAGKEAAKASTFEEPPSDDDGPEKETPPQEEPKKDD